MAESKLFPIIRLCLALILTLEVAGCNSTESQPTPQTTQAVAPPSAEPQATVEPGPAPVIDASQPTAEPGQEANTATPRPNEAVTPAATTANTSGALTYEPLPAQCQWGQVVVADRATIIRAQPELKPGALFSTSGAFAAKPVDTPCDPGPELGPFPVDAGGNLVARLTGGPPAPNQWSLYNNGTGLRIVFEPLLGENNYGPGQEVLAFVIPAEETEAEMGGSWPGPGRLRAYIGAPGGSGPLTSSCFEQSYTAAAEIVEVFESAPAQSGMSFRHGDSMVTEETWGQVLIAASTDWVAPGSEVAVNLFGPELPTREGTWDLATGERPNQWNEAGPAEAVKPAGTEAAFLDAVLRFLGRVKDEKTTARISGLRTSGKLVFGNLPNGTAEWDRETGVLTIRKDILNNLTGDESRDFRAITDAAQSMVHELVHADQGRLTWNTSVYSNYAGQGHSSEADAYYAALDRVAEWWGNIESQWDHSAPPCDQLGSARQVSQLLDLWRVYYNDIQAKSLANRSTVLAEYNAAEQRLSMARNELNGIDDAIRELEEDLKRTTDPDRYDELTANLELYKLEIRPKAKSELNTAEGEYARLEAVFALDGGDAWLELQDRSEIEALIDRRLQEVKDFQAQAKKAGCQESPQPYIQTSPQCDVKLVEMNLKKGAVHIVKPTPGPAAETASQTVTVNLEQKLFSIKPDGTEYSVEKQDETAIVRVYDGQVTITSENGPALTVAAGQQVTLPDSELSALVPEPIRRVGGIPLAELHLDSDLPEPYGGSELRATEGTLPSDWVWQEPDLNLYGPGDATLEVLDEETLRITVPNENDFWGHRSDAPRLLHKATGDFDLEAEMLLESQGTHFAISEFIIFTPDTPLGYLKGQMNAGGLGAQYFIAGGGWSHWQNENRLSVLNREWADAAEAPAEPIRVKLSRRGDQLKTHWSMDGGATWMLSSRQKMAMPETLWVGWLFKRMALDGLNDQPAVTTLRDIRLTTAPLGSMPEADWDVVGHKGTVIPWDTEIMMAQYGSEDSYVQAYSPWSIAGDFDLTVRFEASPIEMQPEQERYIHVAVTSNDEKNHAYVRNAMTPDWHRFDADMAINGGWYRYRYKDTQESSGRLRLVRRDGLFSGYFWKGGEWVLLADWQEGFSDPVYLDFRYQWKTASPILQTVEFSIERLETEAGVLIDTTANPQTAPGSDASQQPPALALTGEQRLEPNALFDDFSSPALDWSVRDNDTATTGYEDGGYAILVKQPTYWVMSQVPGDFPHTVIEFDAAVTPSSAGGIYGVICHYQNGENYDFVAIDPETASVSAGRLLAGEFEFLSGDPNGTTEQPANSLAREVTANNHVRVGCYDDRLELAIGGTTEGTWPLDPPGTAGSAALFVYGFQVLGENGYKTVFDNLAAWHDGTSPATPPLSQPSPATTCSEIVDAQIAMQWDPEALGCPTAPATTIWAAVQAFERGLMIWRDDLPLIYTFDEAGGWASWPDVWSEGVEIPSRGQPPKGLQAPVRGFGFVWATDEQIFQKLGWARWEESGMCATVQVFEKGTVIRRSEAEICAGHINPDASAWFGSVEAYDDGSWR